MKFKLVETYNDYELDDLRDLVQEYLYDAVDALKSASLETYLEWFKEQLSEYDDIKSQDLETVVTDAYIDLIDYKKIKGNKTMITSELKDYIEQHADLLDNNIDELINQCPGYLEHELELVLGKLNESLNEELLTEARTPTYREMFLELLEALSENPKFVQLLKKKSDLNIHHIDSTYNENRKATNNHPCNIAIMSKNAHQELTKLNTAARKEIPDSVELQAAFTNNFYKVMDQFPDEVFDIYNCLPEFVVEIIVKNNVTELD